MGMRKLKLQVQISVDGYIADANGKTDWMIWNWGDEWTWDGELRKYHNNVIASVDCILLSRKMVEGSSFIQHWATMAEKKDNPQSGFANHIRKTHKVVFTKTLKKSEWDNTVLAKGDLADEINKLKNQNGKDIIVYGGATFVSSLIKAELVDEFHLLVNPAALGNGMTIFKELDSKLNLTLVKSKSYDCGIVVLEYVLKND
jgi:dihydrofolate reductase